MRLHFDAVCSNNSSARVHGTVVALLNAECIHKTAASKQNMVSNACKSKSVDISAVKADAFHFLFEKSHMIGGEKDLSWLRKGKIGIIHRCPSHRFQNSTFLAVHAKTKKGETFVVIRTQGKKIAEVMCIKSKAHYNSSSSAYY